MNKNGSAKQVLLVEDNPGDVRLIELAIQKSNLEIKLCHKSNGEEALDYLLKWRDSKKPEKIEMIILDLNLPRKDGFEVLQIIKNDPKIKDIPVLIFTSSEAESDVKRAFELNADGYILKGPTLQDFRNSLLQSLTYWLNMEKNENHFDVPIQAR
ncbi:MAG: response regulator [Bacteriovoracaceae bacterium]|nr:response regulator [Bacteriovoracaceae bacterium]